MTSWQAPLPKAGAAEMRLLQRASDCIFEIMACEPRLVQEAGKHLEAAEVLRLAFEQKLRHCN